MPVISGNNVIFGSADSNVYCLDCKTGREVWRFKTYGHIFGETVIENGRIYAASYDCHLYCLDMEGNLIWKFQTSTLAQTKYDLEEESVVEFKPPEVRQDDAEVEEKYKSEEGSGGYQIESEYLFKSEYSSKGKYA